MHDAEGNLRTAAYFPGDQSGRCSLFRRRIADPIPVRKAIRDGNDKHLIVLTRPKGYKKELSKSHKVTSRLLKRKYPKLPDLLLNRHVEYNRTVRYCERLEREGKAVILRPDHPIDSFEKDIDVLRRLIRWDTIWQ